MSISPPVPGESAAGPPVESPVGSPVGSPAEHAAGPSGSASVVLELGPGAGALVLYTEADLEGTEIEVSRGGYRTHALVRPRQLAGGTEHAVVYPSLPPGTYQVWRADGTLAGAVTVRAGEVASATLSSTADL
jgi:hypothetical protein